MFLLLQVIIQQNKHNCSKRLFEKQPLDKAGAYGIQELDPRFVASIYGDVHTIIGLPVAEVSRRIFDDRDFEK